MKQRLLIVDDEQGIVDIIKSYFSEEYEILTACNGQEAIRKVQEQPDLIGGGSGNWNSRRYGILYSGFC